MKENRHYINIFKLIAKLKIQAIEKAAKKYKDDSNKLKRAIKFIENTAQHSRNLHINLERIVDIEKFEDELPHDLRGPGNKFEIDLIDVMMSDKVTAEKWTPGKEVYSKEEEAILGRHQEQKHHRVIHLENPPEALISIWAADLILAWREKRSYKGVWEWGTIEDQIEFLTTVLSTSKINALKKAKKIQYNNEKTGKIIMEGYIC